MNITLRFYILVNASLKMIHSERVNIESDYISDIKTHCKGLIERFNENNPDIKIYEARLHMDSWV